MKRDLIIEIYEFGSIEGIEEGPLMRAVNKAQSRFFRKQPGFLKGEILRTSDNKWISLSYWNSLEEAQTAKDIFLNDSACLPFVQMISPSSERRVYLQRIFSYKKRMTNGNQSTSRLLGKSAASFASK